MFVANPIPPTHRLRSENIKKKNRQLKSNSNHASAIEAIDRLPFAVNSNSNQDISTASDHETWPVAPMQCRFGSDPISAHFSTHPNCSSPIFESCSMTNSTLSNLPLRAMRSSGRRWWNSLTDQVSPMSMHPALQNKINGSLIIWIELHANTPQYTSNTSLFSWVNRFPVK